MYACKFIIVIVCMYIIVYLCIMYMHVYCLCKGQNAYLNKQANEEINQSIIIIISEK